MTLKEKFAQLFTSQWWKDTQAALYRTGIAGFAPFLLLFASGGSVDWKLVVSQVVLTVVLAIATSLRGIPDPANATYWEVLGGRFLRQGAQFLIAAIGTAILFTDVKWWQVLLGAGASALATVLLGAMTVIPGLDTASSAPVVAIPVEDIPIEPEPEENDPSVIFTDDEPSEDEEADAEAVEVVDGEEPDVEIADGEVEDAESGSRFA